MADVYTAAGNVETFGIPPFVVRQWGILKLWEDDEDEDEVSTAPSQRVELLIPTAWLTAYASALHARLDAVRRFVKHLHLKDEVVEQLTEEVHRRLVSASRNPVTRLRDKVAEQTRAEEVCHRLANANDTSVKRLRDVMDDMTNAVRGSVRRLGDDDLILAWRAASYVMDDVTEHTITEEVYRRLIGAVRHMTKGSPAERREARVRWDGWRATWPGMLFAYTHKRLHSSTKLGARAWDRVALHDPDTAIETWESTCTPTPPSTPSETPSG